MQDVLQEDIGLLSFPNIEPCQWASATFLCSGRGRHITPKQLPLLWSDLQSGHAARSKSPSVQIPCQGTDTGGNESWGGTQRQKAFYGQVVGWLISVQEAGRAALRVMEDGHSHCSTSIVTGHLSVE